MQPDPPAIILGNPGPAQRVNSWAGPAPAWFSIDWPDGSAAPDALLTKYAESILDEKEAVVVSSVDNERYVCALPSLTEGPKQRQYEYFGATPRELLQVLYQQRSCTYRIEMYWTYELCHGRYLMQYHEEKDAARRTTRQEYYLGQYIADTVTEDEKDFDHMNPPKRKIEDQILPYYPIRYVQGTVCDINGEPRMTTIHYVCVPEGKNQIYSLEEVSSCEYEVVVLTPQLCTHPAFQVADAPEHKISCYSLEGSPPHPTALTIWEREQAWEMRQQHKKIVFGSAVGETDEEKPVKSGSKSGDHIQTEQQTASVVDDDDDEETPPRATPQKPTSPPKSAPVDKHLAASFLSGEYCLYGGAGWWKHEYCHGRQVIQFHEDSTTGRTEILLGRWVESVHLQWIAERPHKRPLSVDGVIRQVCHLYSDGALCELTGKPRTVETRLRCRETAGNANAVTLYLLEPKPCEYILGVESQMFCDLLQTADENGLLKAE